MDTIRENNLDLIGSSIGTQGYVRIVGSADGKSYRMSIQDFMDLIAENPAVAELVEAEATARKDADDEITVTVTNLQEMLDLEITARRTADTELRNSISSEVTAREEADTALQKDVTDLKADLNEYIFNKRYNIYDGKLKQDGVYWNDNGVLNESATWGITEYMPLGYGNMFYKNLTTMGTKTRAVFVDENMNFISAFRPQPYLDGREVELDSIVQIPDSAKYISFSLAIKEYSEFQFLFDPNEYLMDDINDISDRVTQIENKQLNNVLVGNDNMIWSWWLYPQAVSLQRVRHKLYYGYVTSDGYKGVAEYDFDAKTVIKNNIMKAGIDDHNALAVYVFPSGRIICAYSTGHNEDNKVRVRRSINCESVVGFEDEIILESAGLTSYAQMCYSNAKLYLFYRTDTKNWAYRTSADEGITWSNETILITSNIQYYCMFRPTNTDDVIRILMYSNPALGADTDTNIRQAFLHTDNNTLYDGDNTTALGTSNINKNNISILIPNETGTLNRQRLFDYAITDVDKPLVLYAPFHMNNDSIYKLYDTGTVIEVCNGGNDIAYTYQMGACFNGANEIIVARGSGVDNGTDFIEQYAFNDGVLAEPIVLHSEKRGNIPIRNFRPIADVNGKAVLWVRGYYDNTTYNNYDTDAKLKVVI